MESASWKPTDVRGSSGYGIAWQQKICNDWAASTSTTSPLPPAAAVLQHRRP
jgi:hypothetical protein